MVMRLPGNLGYHVRGIETLGGGFSFEHNSAAKGK